MDFSKIKTFSIHNRKHKVTASLLGHPQKDSGFADFYDSLPNILAAAELRLAARISGASGKREVITCGNV